MLVNATIQVVPLTNIETAFPVIDAAIAIIQNAGIKYSVGAFETTLEGEYEEVQALIRKVEDFCYNHKELQFLVYTKLHLCGGNHISAYEKTAKFRSTE
jgi:uncharacterized protein YqgV (UPF0045/DUF77 family)